MIYVYRLPPKLSDGYCFGGGRPITFVHVDWMDTPQSGMTLDEVKDWIRQKNYFTASPPEARFLVYCPDDPTFTFNLEKKT